MDDSKKKGQTEPLAPWLLLVMLVFIVIIAIVAYLKVTALLYADRNQVTNYALHSILESTECAPNTRMPLRDVLAIGIGEEKTNTFMGDEVKINYSGKTDTTIPGECVQTLLAALSISTYDFYIEHASLCPPIPGVSGCYGMPNADLGYFNVKTFEYIALPNGETGKAVLKTRGDVV